MHQPPLRLGIVAGHPAARPYVQAAAQLDAVDLVGVALDGAGDPDTLRASPGVSRFDGLDDLHAGAEPDLCLIAGPPERRAGLARRAHDLSLTCAVEPPIGMPATGVSAGATVLHRAPLLPHMRTAAAVVVSGRVGRPVFVRSTAWGRQLAGEAPDADADPSFDELTEHVLGLNWLMAAVPTRVYATAQATHAGGYVTCLITYREGQTGLLDVGAAQTGPEPYDAIFLTGATGAVHADSHRGGPRLFGDGRVASVERVQAPSFAEQALLALAQRAAGRETPLATVADAHAAVRTVSAALESIDAGRPIDLRAEPT